MFKRILKIFVITSLSILLLGFIFLVVVYNGVFGPLHSQEDLKAFKNESASIIWSSDGHILGKIFDKNRTNVDFDKLPTHLVEALVATEDARYFEHDGVDSRSLLRVLYKSIFLNNRSAGGGSTINQQLAKNMFGRDKHGMLTMLVNKTKEGFLAHRLEQIYTKEEILVLYLNTVPFGENIYGIEAASRRFFNKTVTDLKVEEGAILVGLLKANNFYNPRLYPENALFRRNVVLGQMHKYNYLDNTKFDSLKKLPLTLDYANLASEGPANYFLVEVKSEAKQILAQYNKANGTNLDLLKDGLSIKTTLNHALQKNALRAFQSHLSKMQVKLNQQYRKGSDRTVLRRFVFNFLTKSQFFPGSFNLFERNLKK